ncbi:uncharacterized protein PSFLO_06204 [Pseudozyma flocculosa]|uniref:Uncharacterized protein n=1 Tax=Pseudozyma flocculosa TaxID=84751 RepID=A0A5C3F8K5_9BASI|nr:uncharacterized protein PSFLO_06204 [Pseudozyma flocculosa]
MLMLSLHMVASRLIERSARSSNLIDRLDSPAHRDVKSFVQTHPSSKFTLDGERGSGKSVLCAKQANGQLTCTEIALEARHLFSTMQSLNFFCALPQDPAKTHINCEPIPQ